MWSRFRKFKRHADTAAVHARSPRPTELGAKPQAHIDVVSNMCTRARARTKSGHRWSSCVCMCVRSCRSACQVNIMLLLLLLRLLWLLPKLLLYWHYYTVQIARCLDNGAKNWYGHSHGMINMLFNPNLGYMVCLTYMCVQHLRRSSCKTSNWLFVSVGVFFH